MSRLTPKTEGAAKLDLNRYLEDRRQKVDQVLGEFLPSAAEPPGRLHEAMRYSLFAGGKRIRPILSIAALECLGGDWEALAPVLSAIELIHTYSLIHDDLPAMDDDDTRRGLPTSHKQFDEATAILAGDALLTSAFEMLSDPHRVPSLSAETRLRVIDELVRAAGSSGMVGGQFVDIETEGKKTGQPVSEETVHYIHTHKTGSLIRAAVRIGALLGEADEKTLASLTTYGEKAGLAFQIVDDILDVEGTEGETGKRVGKDEAHSKLTYPGVFGLAESREHANRLKTGSLEALSGFGSEAEPLRAIVRFIVERKS